MKTKPPGPSRTARTPQNVDRVRDAIQRSPGRSARRHATELGLSKSTVKRILHKDLGFHPYKIMIVQKLNDADYQQRVMFAETMLNMFEENDDIKILMSDEAHFHLDGTVNKQNCRYWALENPRELHQRPLHSQKVTVWCAVGKFGIFGPFFFEENERTVTITSERYVNMMTNFFIPELERQGIDPDHVWFQQDGATAHTARASMAAVRALFPGRLISRFGDVAWPPRSPDLSMCDFFLWGHLKANVYKEKPRTQEELKNAIRYQIELINEQLLIKVETSFRERLNMCVNSNGRHLGDVIFKK
ncbi:uncharacterized protein LOC128996153 [Macrosteles quadrilineatus]|uniref:uncharacterized protein LOC128984918 n=1 Tax=Macrosteles quadrilineatus TaxID=74068 RepID=UPI0023E2EEFC|nr:uncharacterized protein LOC128984918 [Macrosteles quadrilineatus]XP_054277268.1 uncharacterized protein LOC128996153 [Macrosteles quadrilineatus]